MSLKCHLVYDPVGYDAEGYPLPGSLPHELLVVRRLGRLGQALEQVAVGDGRFLAVRRESG